MERQNILKAKKEQLSVLVEKNKEISIFFDKNKIKIKTFIEYADEINQKVCNNHLDEQLLIKGTNKIGKDYSNKKVADIISNIEKQFDELFTIEDAEACVTLNKKIGDNLAYIKDYLDFIKETASDTIISKLEREIVELEQQLMNQSNQDQKSYNVFDRSLDYTEDFILYKSYKQDEFVNFYKHSFAKDNYNLLFTHNSANDKKVSEGFEDIFIRLLYKFDYSILEIQPIGLLPIGLKGFIGSVNKDMGDNTIFKSPLVDEGEVDLYFSNLYELVSQRAEKYYSDGDFFSYNKSHLNKPDKAIFVFLYNYPCFVSKKADMFIKTLINENSNKYGIFFIIDYLPSLDTNGNRLKFDESYNCHCFGFEDNKITDNGVPVDFDLYDETFDRKSFFKELNSISAPYTNKEEFVKEEKKIETTSTKKSDDILEQMIAENEDTTDYTDKLLIPVGKDENGNTVNVSFETKNEKCSMIVAGGTGSGKSEFLHTLIVSSCLKYSPKQLNLYLIDFKDGVEFAPYSKYLSLPHIKLISCRNSVTDALMILEEIKNEKTRRNELFKTSNCSNISQYNKNNPDKAMPRLLIILDEYQVMLNTDARLSAKIEDVLESLAREIRSAGISLVLSSQTAACSRNVLAQITNRVCFKVKDNSLSNLIDSLRDSDRDALNEKPAGSGYFSNGEQITQFRSYYVGETDKRDGTGKDKYAALIKKKYPNDIDFILSNDTRQILFSDVVDNNEKDTLVDFGISVFNNKHIKKDFPIESNNFSNPYILGDKAKALEIEYAMLSCLSYKRQKFDTSVFTFKSMKKPLIETAFMGDASWSSYSVEDLINKVNEIYDVYQERVRTKGKGENIDGSPIVIFINSFSKSKITSIEEDNSNEDSESVFSWDKPAKKSVVEKIIELYSKSYQYGIYIILHFDSKEQIKELFGFDEAHNDCAIYVDEKAIQYYAEKCFMSTQNKIELEDRTSVYVRDGIAIKFKRYSFE